MTFLDGAAESRVFFDAPGPFYCLMRKPAFDGFVAQGVPLRIAYEREGLSVTSGRVLWRRHLPETHFVLATRAAEAGTGRTGASGHGIEGVKKSTRHSVVSVFRKVNYAV